MRSRRRRPPSFQVPPTPFYLPPPARAHVHATSTNSLTERNEGPSPLESRSEGRDFQLGPSKWSKEAGYTVLVFFHTKTAKKAKPLSVVPFLPLFLDGLWGVQDDLVAVDGHHALGPQVKLCKERIKVDVKTNIFTISQIRSLYSRKNL